MVERYDIDLCYDEDCGPYRTAHGDYVLFEDYEALRLALVKFIQKLDPEQRFVREDDLAGLQDHIDSIFAKREAGDLC